MSYQLDPNEYYRLPWSFTDNGISWLEVTSACNLKCKGCYRDRRSTGHKTLKEIAEDLEVFKRERKSDCMSIAGGDPLVHPEIVEIVRMVSQGGWKPVVNTNGLALTPNLLKQLKKAGVVGFTFHIDTSQDRFDSPDAESETDHNEIRQHFADMLAAEGGIACSFNQTVTLKTLDQIPQMIRWAQKNAGLVHTMVFILYREPRMLGNYDYFVNGKQVDLGSIYEQTNWGEGKILEAQDLVDKIIGVDPAYRPSGYLNGTVDARSMKWLLGVRIGTNDQTYGYVTPKFMETVQNGSHLFRGKWISYSTPKYLAAGRTAAFALAPFDRGMRKIAGNYLKSVIRNPKNLFKKAHLQSYMIIQPVDFMEDGRMNMCDGCPDITVHKGKLYWSCRLEEIKNYGTFVTAVPKALRAQVKQDKILDREQEAPAVIQ